VIYDGQPVDSVPAIVWVAPLQKLAVPGDHGKNRALT